MALYIGLQVHKFFVILFSISLLFSYRIPHTCHGNCPKQSWPIWEIPINELDRREDPKFDEELTGCPLVSSCTNIQVGRE